MNGVADGFVEGVGRRARGYTDEHPFDDGVRGALRV